MAAVEADARASCDVLHELACASAPTGNENGLPALLSGDRTCTKQPRYPMTQYYYEHEARQMLGQLGKEGQLSQAYNRRKLPAAALACCLASSQLLPRPWPSF